MPDAIAGSFAKTMKIRDAEGTVTTSGTTTLEGVITTDNTAVYVPTADYHPATKKYVDNSTGGVSVLTLMDDTQIEDSLNGGTDGLPVWNDMLTELDKSDDNYAVWPSGLFLFDDTLTVDQLLILRAPNAYATIFYWTTDVTGLELTTAYSSWDGFTIKSGIGSSDGSFYPTAFPGTDTSYGVHAKVKFEMQRCSIRQWPGHGIFIDGDATTANVWHLNQVQTFYNGGEGLRVRGDASVGSAIGVDSKVNGGAGIYDLSGKGNAYHGCHTSTNGRQWGQCCHGGKYYQAGTAVDSTTEPLATMTSWDDEWKYTGFEGVPKAGFPAWSSGTEYRYCPGYRVTGANSYNVFTGCYDEQNGSPISVTANTTFVGGSTGTEGSNKDAVLLSETTTPTAIANYGKVYCKSDNKLYFQDGAGVEHEVAFA